jgi:hypothetical protein
MMNHHVGVIAAAPSGSNQSPDQIDVLPESESGSEAANFA